MSASFARKLVSSSILRLALTMCSAMVAYFMLPFLSHHLGAYDYGIWAVAVAIIGYYGFLDLGVSSAVGRFVGKAYGQNNFKDVNKVTTTAFSIFAIISLCAIGITVLGAFTAKHLIEDVDKGITIFYMVLCLGIGFSTQFPVRALAGIVYAAVDHQIIVISELMKLIFKTVLIVVVVLQGHGLVALAVSVGLAEILGNMLQYYLIFHKFPELKVKRQYISKDLIKPLFNYSWVAFIARITEMLKTKFIPIFVSALIGVEFVVFYVVALRLMEYLNQFVATITGIFAPVVSRFEDNIQHLQATYEHVSSVVVSISLYLGISIAFYSKWLIPLWMGPGFEVSYALTLVMCVPFMMISIQRISREVLFGISKHKYCAIINMFEFVLAIVLGVIFNYLYGTYGIALGFAIAIMLGESIFPVIVGKSLNLNISNIYFNIFAIPMIKVTLPLTAFFIIANQYVESTYWSLIKWNIIQISVLAPVLYFTLPINVRRNVFGFIEARTIKARAMVANTFN